jgi:hypothetical protein
MLPRLIGYYLSGIAGREQIAFQPLLDLKALDDQLVQPHVAPVDFQIAKVALVGIPDLAAQIPFDMLLALGRARSRKRTTVRIVSMHLGVEVNRIDGVVAGHVPGSQLPGTAPGMGL